MSTKRPEFSRIVPLAHLGTEPFRQEIAATEAERQALARRFGLLALDRLMAEVELLRQGQDTILLRAAFEAAFAQECVVTLDPVESAMAANFALRYGPPDAESEDAIEAEEAFEPLVDDFIDVGEAVAQEFSLALPPFPRSPGAALEIEETRPEGGPFAALSDLADRQKP